MFSTAKVLNHFSDFKKTEFFEPLPEDLSDYEKWLPAFRLFDGSVGAVMVLLKPKDTRGQCSTRGHRRVAEERPEPTSSVVDLCPHTSYESSASDKQDPPVQCCHHQRGDTHSPQLPAPL